MDNCIFVSSRFFLFYLFFLSIWLKNVLSETGSKSEYAGIGSRWRVMASCKRFFDVIVPDAFPCIIFLFLLWLGWAQGLWNAVLHVGPNLRTEQLSWQSSIFYWIKLDLQYLPCSHIKASCTHRKILKNGYWWASIN